MKKLKLIRLLLMVILLVSYNHTNVIAKAKTHQKKRTYIVHMDKSNMPTTFNDHFQWYDCSLKSVSNTATMLYTYNKAIHGFSTRLTAKEAQSLEALPGILSVLPEVRYEPHTTRTPHFLGLENALMPESQSVSEVIIGVLDYGVWPFIKSFDDTGLGPVPSNWKGECEEGNNFYSSSCNRKLIGARFFSKGYEATCGEIDETEESRSPIDDDGHGTHTATIAAGSAVTGASFFGYAKGTARGMAASARIAAYKVCWKGGCFNSDILAAMDMAIEDGVNVLSISIGIDIFPYRRNSISVGAFAATENGVFVSCSAGNDGPNPGTLSNVAPWVTTVGAGTLDRKFPAYISLGNGQNFTGVSLYSGEGLPVSLLPLAYAGNVSNSTNGNLCTTGSLIPEKVAGKIVVCDRGGTPRLEKSVVVKAAGGAGMILTNTESYRETVSYSYLLPTAAVGQIFADSIKSYLFSDPNPTATITFGGTRLGIQPSPVVAAFSSRGPNLHTPKILKPDLIAPGVNILAGWTGATGPTGLPIDTRRVRFNIMSGTSMSCPHVSGLAALIKAAHPEWSPAAIRSALMTTAYTKDKSGRTIRNVDGTAATPFDYGAGHVNPMAALDPGLVYDATVDDYIDFLCAINYSSIALRLLTRNSGSSCELGKKYSVGDLNYPSFAIPFKTASDENGGSGASSTVKYTRTLTNVGSPATYKVQVSSQNTPVNILIEPESLSFTEPLEKKSYAVTFTASSMPSGTTSFASLEWSDGEHIVGSPIAFTWT